MVVHTSDEVKGNAGVANICGLPWSARLLNRDQVWTPFVNGFQRQTDTQPSDGNIRCAHPDAFALSHIALAAGDTVDPTRSKAAVAEAGDLVGYDMRLLGLGAPRAKASATTSG